MNKRVHERRDFMARVEIHFQNPAGESAKVTGMVEDRSVGGMLIRVKAVLAPGSTITIRSAVEEFQAIVRRSVRSDNGHLVGVEFVANPS